MNRKKEIGLGLFLISALHFVSFSQDWMPVPYRQNNFYEDQNRHQITNMDNDQQINDNEYRLNGGTLSFDFGYCAYYMWHPANGQALPQCLLQRFYMDNSVITLRHYSQDFQIDLSEPIGSTQSFRIGFTIKYLDKYQGTFLGITDSIREYEVYKTSYGLVGSLKLSKHYGLIEFPSFKEMDFGWNASAIQKLCGFESSSNVKYGLTAPESVDFSPYSIGDTLLFEYEYDGVNGLEIEYHYIILTQAFTEAIKGDAIIFDQYGNYLNRQKDYFLDFNPMFKEAVRNFISVPYVSDSDEGDLETTSDFWLINDKWITIINGVNRDYCDSSNDYSYRQFLRLDGNHGLEIKERDYYDSQGSEKWELIAGIGKNFNYKTMPDFVGIKDVYTQTLDLFPNPAQNMVQVRGINSGTYSVIDLTGKLVDSGVLNSSNLIDLCSLMSGVYFINITTQSGLNEMHRIVKQ